MAWQKERYEMNGVKFQSEPEFKVYNYLLGQRDQTGAIMNDGSFRMKEYGVYPHLPAGLSVMNHFRSLTGKAYLGMNYEPDFTLKPQFHYGTGKRPTFILEVKGHNDLILKFMKGSKPQIKDNSEVIRLKHKIIDQELTKQGLWFVVVRVSNLKSAEYGGCFWEKDWEQVLKYKTQQRPDLAIKVPRLIERLNKWIDGEHDLFSEGSDEADHYLGGDR